MQNLRKTNETGRSMVEMLGVLAIIGVLSVAGVAGYKAAVRKSLANNLLNQASMRATDVATQIGSGNLESLGNDAFDGNLGSGVTMSSAVKGPDGYADYDESDEQFTLTLEGLDEELCQQMQSMAGGSRSVVRAVLCDGDKAILTFNKDLSSNPVSSDFDGNKEGCESSGRKYCDNDTCILATEECPTGGSTEGDESGEKLWEPTLCEDSTDCLGECEICNGWGECVKSQSDTCSCSADEMEVDYDGDGVIDCIPCTYSWGMSDISADGCAKCPNREMDENDEYCVLKECPSGYLKDPYSDCYPCDSLDDIWDISAEECAKCPNRKMNEDGYYCLLSECPDGYVFDVYRERCESCDERESFLLESPEECAKCPNREIDPSYEDAYICTIKCPDNHYKDTHDQSCVSCDDVTATRSAKKSECDKCPNREMITFGSENLCALKECPAGRMQDGNLHDCYSCTTTYGVPTDDQLECAKCENRQLITTKAGFKACVLKECPDGKPVDDWGDC